eukprot:1133151-Pelagomonas_calceolata.AAC.7
MVGLSAALAAASTEQQVGMSRISDVIRLGHFRTYMLCFTASLHGRHQPTKLGPRHRESVGASSQGLLPCTSTPILYEYKRGNTWG